MPFVNSKYKKAIDTAIGRASPRKVRHDHKETGRFYDTGKEKRNMTRLDLGGPRMGTMLPHDPTTHEVPSNPEDTINYK